MKVWLAKPLYESLPYGYLTAGCILIAAVWINTQPSLLERIAFDIGVLLLIAGLMVWLHRRDYRLKLKETPTKSA